MQNKENHKQPFLCYFCHQEGHTQLSCRKRKKHLKANKKNQENQVQVHQKQVKTEYRENFVGLIKNIVNEQRFGNDFAQKQSGQINNLLKELINQLKNLTEINNNNQNKIIEDNNKLENLEKEIINLKIEKEKEKENFEKEKIKLEKEKTDLQKQINKIEEKKEKLGKENQQFKDVIVELEKHNFDLMKQHGNLLDKPSPPSKSTSSPSLPNNVATKRGFVAKINMQTIGKQKECEFCGDEFINQKANQEIFTVCKHIICDDCIETSFEKNNFYCPFCFEEEEKENHKRNEDLHQKIKQTSTVSNFPPISITHPSSLQHQSFLQSNNQPIQPFQDFVMQETKNCITKQRRSKEQIIILWKCKNCQCENQSNQCQGCGEFFFWKCSCNKFNRTPNCSNKRCQATCPVPFYHYA